MSENEIASFVRKALTAEWPDCTWQVLVGRNFGSYVKFEESRYIYFYIAQVCVATRLLALLSCTLHTCQLTRTLAFFLLDRR